MCMHSGKMSAHSWLPISCGGTTVAELKRGTFFALNVAPGRYTLVPKEGLPFIISVKAGEESFLRLGWQSEIGRSSVPVLSLIRPAEARKEMRYLGYIRGSKILSDSVSKTDPRKLEEPQLKTRGKR